MSCIGAFNGWILIVGQLPLAVAEDGLFPSILGRRSSHGAPTFGLIIGAILATGMIAMNYTRGLVSLFTFVILLSTLSTLVPYVFCSLAGFVSPRAAPGTRGTRGTPGTPGTHGTRGTPGTPGTPGTHVISALAFAYSLWAIGGAGADVVYWGFLLLMAGLPVYVWVVRK
jgi:APA family basic amino acid/polyamine antiporter